MKKAFVVLAAFTLTYSSFAAAPSDVSQKVLSAFAKTFQGVSKVAWSEHADYYEVRFWQGKIDTRVKYNMQGDILEAIRYYSEADLPLLLKSKIQNKYPDKKVFGVTEVTKDAELTYYIVLEDEKNWTNIQSDFFGNIMVQKKYKKA